MASGSGPLERQLAPTLRRRSPESRPPVPAFRLRPPGSGHSAPGYRPPIFWRTNSFRLGSRGALGPPAVRPSGPGPSSQGSRLPGPAFRLRESTRRFYGELPPAGPTIGGALRPTASGHRPPIS